jgi:FKBP-type peptidyl-prolyl cis-trans isomerase SlyD
MYITNKTIVTIDFTVCTSDGTQIDTTKNSEPMVFLQGSHVLIQGLEDELENRLVGDKFVIDITPELAYGERHDALVQSVPKTMFEDMELNVGMSFRASTDDGEQSVIIIDINEEEVIVDGNHPLSGLTLNFDVEIKDVRIATEEEIAHGHPHTDDGFSHSH